MIYSHEIMYVTLFILPSCMAHLLKILWDNIPWKVKSSTLLVSYNIASSPNYLFQTLLHQLNMPSTRNFFFFLSSDTSACQILISMFISYEGHRNKLCKWAFQVLFLNRHSPQKLFCFVSNLISIVIFLCGLLV